MLKTSAMASCKPETNRKHRDGVLNKLRDLFGNVLHVDIIRSVASECEYDVERSSNVLLEMTNNIDDAPKKKEKMKKSPKKSDSPKTTPQKSKKAQELERVVSNIRQGYKVLVILRGLPGSGKSRLAVAITDVTLGPGNNSQHILSTDDFFQQRNGYFYDPSRLSEAHEWNHRRAFMAMSRGLSPVIIDNTNTQMWEMKPYAMMATDYGYMIEILEPDTWWAFNDKELAKRNTHGVPRTKIKDMLDRYEKNVTTSKLLYAYNLIYKFQQPPQLRLLPPIMNNGFRYQKPIDGVVKSKSTPALDGVNLMEFSEVSNETQQSSSDDPWVAPNSVDDILMFTEENTTEILQPKPASPKPFPDIENAWGVDEKALQSWDIVTPILGEFQKMSMETGDQEEAKPETRESSTCVEVGDYLKENSVSGGYRIVVANGRDISVGSPMKRITPPKKTMVDESSMTDDVIEEEVNEEKRIKDLMDLFPKLPKSSLRELFHKCNKNFHWTVDLLLDDNSVIEGKNDEDEEENEKIESTETENVSVVEEKPPDENKEEKIFKKKTVSEDSLELKKCLESKFDINKEHYSEHVYKVKQTKFGGCDPQPSTSMAMSDSDSDSDDDSSNADENPKDMIELNLGETFVDQLETMFGGNDVFPKGYQPVVQMPVALARQIYSFYIESICQQMEAQNHILERLVKEDEDFARKLQNEETPVVAKVPTLPEIMNEQMAMNQYQRNVDEWKNLTADNLAVKLTKQKLLSAFPNVDKEALLEIWHAYDYDYNKTVEDLIASVGVENVEGDSVREPPLTKTALQEMKEAEELCEFEESEEQKPATYYREQASKHLKRRSELYEKARSYYQRGMTEVALFYSDLAKKETNSFDKANHFAAAAFIEEHSKRLQKFDTLDLHYFYVKEAIPNLDMFIDRNINLLRGSKKRGQDLFIITGRGNNSLGGKCKIKPAVIKRLKERKIGFVQLNPGLLKIRVSQECPITSDIP